MVHGQRKRGHEHKLKCIAFYLNIIKNPTFFTALSMVKYWKELPTKIVEIGKMQPDMALANLL